MSMERVPRISKITLAPEVKPVDLLMFQIAQRKRSTFQSEIGRPGAEIGVSPDKADGLLIADDGAHRPGPGRDPIDKLQTMIAITPLPGQKKAVDASVVQIGDSLPPTRVSERFELVSSM